MTSGLFFRRATRPALFRSIIMKGLFITCGQCRIPQRASMEDERIIELYNSRDEAAIEETRNRYGSRIRAVAAGILRDEEDAKECESDTYFKAWNSIPPQQPRHFFAYLAKITRNSALTRLEAANAAKRRAELIELTDELQQCVPDVMAQRSFEAAETGELLSSFLRSENAESRVIFIRRYWLAQSVAEIAGSLGFSESKVKSSLMHTRERLRGFLEKEGIEI